ncbi:MAG: transposase [bacterium]|nr:transposase [bacterium]
MLRKDRFVTGEYYHLYNRGVDKRTIFKSKNDYERLIMLLYIANSNKEQSLRLDNLINHSHKTFDEVLVVDKGESLVSIGAWCLMTNHFHLLVRQEVDGGITKFMKKLGTGYSMYFNIKYQRHGALFGGLFKSKLVGSSDNYLKQLLAYIHLNCLDIEFSGWTDKIKKESNEMKKFLETYRYSSYLDYIITNINNSNRVEKNILNKENFPDYFGDAKSFKGFVEDYFIESHL